MAQQKKTEAFELPAEVEDLSPADARFALGIIQGKTGIAALEASRDCSNMSVETRYSYASRLKNDSKIAAWIQRARVAALETGKVTAQGHLAELARLREIALSTGNVGAAVNAEVSRGKAQGIYVERIEDARSANDTTLTLEQLKECLVSLPPDVRMELAKALTGDGPKAISRHT